MPKALDGVKRNCALTRGKVAFGNLSCVLCADAGMPCRTNRIAPPRERATTPHVMDSPGGSYPLISPTDASWLFDPHHPSNPPSTPPLTHKGEVRRRPRLPAKSE